MFKAFKHLFAFLLKLIKNKNANKCLKAFKLNNISGATVFFGFFLLNFDF